MSLLFYALTEGHQSRHAWLTTPNLSSKPHSARKNQFKSQAAPGNSRCAYQIRHDTVTRLTGSKAGEFVIDVAWNLLRIPSVSSSAVDRSKSWSKWENLECHNGSAESYPRCLKRNLKKKRNHLITIQDKSTWAGNFRSSSCRRVGHGTWILLKMFSWIHCGVNLIEIGTERNSKEAKKEMTGASSI